MVAPIPRYEHTLTGRVRIRPGWFGRMVPQVQVLVQTFSLPCPPPPHYDAQRQKEWNERERTTPKSSWTEWRDATWLDLQERGRFVLEASP
jgi:hypothetical protein